jgi:hypothetical protein
LFPLYSSNPCILIRILFFSKYSPWPANISFVFQEYVSDIFFSKI